MNYGNFKDLYRRTACDNILHNKALSIVKNPEYNQYQRGLASMVYICFDKKFSGGSVTRAWSDSSAAWDKSAIKSRIQLFRTNN